jgi:hypothetical protein
MANRSFRDLLITDGTQISKPQRCCVWMEATSPGSKTIQSSFLFSPYYHARNSCFPAQIWTTALTLAAKSQLPCPHLSDGERVWTYRKPFFGDTTRGPAVRNNPHYFLLSPCLRVQRSCLLVAASSRCASVVKLLVFTFPARYQPSRLPSHADNLPASG